MRKSKGPVSPDRPARTDRPDRHGGSGGQAGADGHGGAGGRDAPGWPDDPDECASTIFTAGFSNLPQETFLSNLRAHGVQVVVDVRSRPYASYTPHFNKERIEAAVREAGLGYVYLGRELGGLPDNPGFYDDEGHVLYDRIAGTEAFQTGIERVLNGLRKGYCMALTCGEDNPRECHRRLLLAKVLREEGVAVAHILANGTLISEAELLEEERKAPRQLSLFGGEAEQERAWRSKSAVAAVKRPDEREE